MKTWLTLEDVAGAEGLDYATVYRAVREGTLPAYRFSPRGRYLIDPNDLPTFRAAHRVAPRPLPRRARPATASTAPAGRPRRRPVDLETVHPDERRYM